MPSKLGGYTGKVITVDLSTKEIKEYPWTDKDRELFIGGKIMAAKIIGDNISTKSSLTGILTSSNCGGGFGYHLKKLVLMLY